MQRNCRNNIVGVGFRPFGCEERSEKSSCLNLFASDFESDIRQAAMLALCNVHSKFATEQRLQSLCRCCTIALYPFSIIPHSGYWIDHAAKLRGAMKAVGGGEEDKRQIEDVPMDEKSCGLSISPTWLTTRKGKAR